MKEERAEILQNRAILSRQDARFPGNHLAPYVKNKNQPLTGTGNFLFAHQHPVWAISLDWETTFFSKFILECLMPEVLAIKMLFSKFTQFLMKIQANDIAKSVNDRWMCFYSVRASLVAFQMDSGLNFRTKFLKAWRFRKPLIKRVSEKWEFSLH